MELFLISTVVIVVVMFYWKHRRSFRFAEKIELHHSHVPFLGHTLLVLGKSREQVFKIIRNTFLDHDRLFQVRFGLQAYICSSHPDIMREVLDNPRVMNKSKDYRFFGVDEGLIASPYAIWKLQRRTLNSSFNKRILENFIPLFDTCARKMIDGMKSTPNRFQVDVMQHCSRCTLNMVCGSILGTNITDDSEASKLIPLIARALDTVSRRAMNIFLHPNFVYKMSGLYGKEMKLRTALNQFIQQLITDKKLTSQVTDASDIGEESYRKPQIIIDHLLQRKRSGKPFTDTEILHQSLSLILAGNDTSALAICNGLTLLAMYQDVQEKAREEIMSMFPSNIALDISPEALKQLSYLEQCINETLRVCPSVPMVGRSCTDDVQVEGIVIPKGSTFIFSIAALHRRKDFWGEDADRFDPDRFSPERSKDRPSHAFAPFSLGQRDCIGKQYAMMSMKILLVHLLRNFRFHSALKFEEMEFTFDITLKLSQGYTFKLEPLDMEVM